MAEILEREVRLVQRTVATSAYVEIEPSDGVELLGSELIPSEKRGARMRIELGSLVPGQPRQALVRVRVKGTPGDDKELAKARLVYRPVSQGSSWAVQTISLRASIGNDWQLAEMCKHPALRAMVARYTGAQSRMLAAEMMRHGEIRQPATMLEAAGAVLEDAARAIPPSGERFRLLVQAADIREASERVRHAAEVGMLRVEAKATYAKAFEDVGLSPPSATP
jgi:hypothetical protein